MNILDKVSNLPYSSYSSNSLKTNDKIKAIQTKSHKETNTYTFINREKVKKYIYIYLYIFKKKEEESNQINNQIYQ